VKRRNRLSRSRDFDTVFRKGRSVSTRYLVLYSFPRPDESEEESRLGLAVSRKVGGAVERNRIKRRLRAAFDELRESLPAGHDYVLIVRPGFGETAEARGYEWVLARVGEVFGLAEGAAT
jgi:ribonuclease P protein component